jgi:drug/metabolite transporter (DMT)-like permease
MAWYPPACKDVFFMTSTDDLALRVRTITCTSIALVAFAANSVLCRLALGRGAIDAASFSAVRLISGAATLAVLVLLKREGTTSIRGNWTSAGMLFLYAVPFSFAYLSLGAGTGALILFGSVQITMMACALGRGERPHALQWLGLAVALGGLVYLVSPGLEAPSPLGSALMAVAGVSWGVYTLLGRGQANPLARTAGNFARSVPMILIVSLVSISRVHASAGGILLAIASGALASGLGYVIWYAALGGLTATRAAVVQLTVPVLAAVGGIAFLGETLSGRLVLATVLILGGVALALLAREHFKR